MDHITVRSVFDPNVTFSIHDRRATLELWKYGCVIIVGAGGSLAETSSVGNVLRQKVAAGVVTKTGDIPLEFDLQCIKKEFFLNEAVLSLISRVPGSVVLAVGSYQPMAVFYHAEAESTNLWYNEAAAGVIGFQTLHLGADTATFSIGLYATAAPDGGDRNIRAVAYGGDIVVYRGRVPRTIPNLLEPGGVGFAMRVSYLHSKNLNVNLGPLPLPIVERYKEEGGDSVFISDAGHAILVCGDKYGSPEAEPKGLIPAPSNPTGIAGGLLALAQQVLLKGPNVRSEYKDLVGIIYRAMHNEPITPADEQLLINISDNYLSEGFSCPVTGCSKKYRNRDDLVKHIRKTSGATRESGLRLHHELDVKYQGMELICCGETQTNFGVLVKHMKSHRGTDPLQDIELGQPGRHLLLDANSYMTVQIQRGWRNVVM